MKKNIFQIIIAGFFLLTTLPSWAQKVTTKAVDNKGTIKWVIDSTSVFITPNDTAGMLANYLEHASNGVRKDGDTVKLGGTLTEVTTITTTATEFLRVLGLQGGTTADSLVVVDGTSGQLKRMSVQSLLGNLTYKNGITRDADTVKLGGALTQATTITTDATNTLSIGGLQSGAATDSIVVADPSTGELQRVSSSTLLNNLKVANGLTKVGDSIKLGGTLNQPTTITTDATNTLTIDGLQSGSLATDSILVATSAGVIKRVASSTLLQSGEQNFVATGGQTAYSVTNMPADYSRVWVYRNGVKLVANVDYTTAAGQVTLTPSGWAVIADDVIEVHWVK